MLATSAILVIIAIGANWAGLRMSGRLQLGLAGCLAALLVLAIATSVPHARLANLRPFAPHGWLALGHAAVLLVWSFAGWEAVTYLAAEFRDPERDLRRATAAALALIGVLYLGVVAMCVLVLGPDLGRVDAPLALLLARSLGASVRWVAAGVAFLVTLGTMNAYLAGASRLGAALGRDGALPVWLSRGSRAGEVPRRSLAVLAAQIAVVLTVASATGLQTQVLLLGATSCFAAVYAVGCAAGVRLLPRGSLGRFAAILATPSVAVLLVLAGPFLVWPIALAAGAFHAQRARARQLTGLAGRGPRPVDDSISSLDASGPEPQLPFTNGAHHPCPKRTWKSSGELPRRPPA